MKTSVIDFVKVARSNPDKVAFDILPENPLYKKLWKRAASKTAGIKIAQVQLRTCIALRIDGSEDMIEQLLQDVYQGTALVHIKL